MGNDTIADKPNVRLGDQLISLGLIDEECLKLALRKHRKDGILLGEALIALGFVNEDVISKILAADIDVEFVDILSVDVDPEAVLKVPLALAKEYHVFPFKFDDELIHLAVDDVYNLVPLDRVWKLTGLRVKPYVAPIRDIEAAIDRYYTANESIDDIIDILIDGSIADHSLEAPVVRLLDKLVAHAVRHHATDLHIEPAERTLGVRMRVDGQLQDVCLLPLTAAPALVSRVKILSDLDPAERRLPQDGSYTAYVGHRQVEIRVATVPTIYGEKSVMRILDRSAVELSLSGIELPFALRENTVSRLHLDDPYGAILVTGPTGSGKTTTLYAMLNEIQSKDKAIFTIEDPVEYRLKGIQQISVRDEIGFSFSTVLRSLLRQDPDIMMVGEIRDTETAALAIQAALTGHLVLSTLHTNNALETLFRLIEMGIEPYLIPPALHGVLSQRLVRRLCPHCRKQADADFIASVIKAHGLDVEKDWQFFWPVGCAKCHNGYVGRIAIFEWLDLDRSYHEVISHKSSLAELESLARERGFRPMVMDGLDKAAAGLTTIDEVLRVTRSG